MSERRRGETTGDYRKRKAVIGRAEAQTQPDAELEAERRRYRAAQGVGGLGGAAKRTSAAFQAKEKAHLDAWRAKRAVKKKGASGAYGRSIADLAE